MLNDYRCWMIASKKLLFSHSVVSYSLWPRGLLLARLPCPSLSPRVEFAQTHVHWVSDAIQLSHRLLPPSPPVLNFSQHQGLFQWVSFLHQVAKVLELQLQYPMNIQGWFPLGLTGLIALLSKGLWRVLSSTTVRKPQPIKQRQLIFMANDL